MRLACRNTLFCVRESGWGDATLAAKFILAEAGTRLCAQNAITLIACTVGSHASAPRNDQEQKHGGLAIVKTGVVPTTLTEKRLGEIEDLLDTAKGCLTTAAAVTGGPEANAVPEAAKNKPVAPCHSSRKPLPTSLPRETVRIEPTETSCPACGGELAALGETVSEQLDIINNAFRVIETVRPKLACRKCDAIVQALAEKLSPLAKALNRYILAAGKTHTDDTTVPVLAPGSGKTRTARL